jgi:hypothetical protein
VQECERQELATAQKEQLFPFRVYFYAPDDGKEERDLYFKYYTSDDAEQTLHEVPRYDSNTPETIVTSRCKYTQMQST